MVKVVKYLNSLLRMVSASLPLAIFEPRWDVLQNNHNDTVLCYVIIRKADQSGT